MAEAFKVGFHAEGILKPRPPERANALAEINVTPLVDVMLVLLIIFMVTAPMIKEGVGVDLPKVRSAAMNDDSDQLVVTVDAKGQIFIGQTRVNPANLTEKLRAISAVKNVSVAYMRADKAVPAGKVMETMAAMRKAGIKRLGMVTEPPDRR